NATLFAVGLNPQVAISNVSVVEGDSGTTNAVFTVTLASSSTQTVIINYATANGTALAGSDYVAASGTLTFNPGETTKPITVQVNGDTTDEPDETYFVNLSSSTAGTAQALGTIVNDDPHPGMTIADASVTEGNSGTKTLNFTVSLLAASGRTVT